MANHPCHIDPVHAGHLDPPVDAMSPIRCRRVCWPALPIEAMTVPLRKLSVSFNLFLDTEETPLGRNLCAATFRDASCTSATCGVTGAELNMFRAKVLSRSTGWAAAVDDRAAS